MKQDYTKLSKQLVDVLGGKDNISFFTHCTTRLRATLKDKNLVDSEKVKTISGVLDCRWTGDQIQIIIGTHVPDVYDAICEYAGLEKQEAIDENLDDEEEQTKQKNRFSFYYIVEIIAFALQPALTMFIGAGMIKVLLIFLDLFAILPSATSTYQLLFNAADAIYYFMPLFLGYGVAKKMNTEPAVGMAMGAILLAPTFIANVNGGTAMDFLGIDIYLKAYNGTFLPAILTSAVGCLLYRFLDKRIPLIVRKLIAPLVTMLIMVPLSYLVLGPIASIIGDYIAAAVMWLYNLTGFVGVAIFGILLPLLITTGMHFCFSPYWSAMVTAPGGELFYLISNCIYNINAGIACIVMSFKTKNIENKALFSSTGISSVVAGVSEPALFGVLLKNRKVLYAVMIGNAFGCAVAGLLHVAAHMWPPSWGVFMIPAFIDDTGMGLIYTLLAVGVGIVATAVATFVLYDGKDVVEE